MVVDFNKIKTICDNWIQSNWDHSILIYDKDVELIDLIRKLSFGNRYFITEFNTTAENMAKFLFEIFRNELEKEQVKVLEVRVWETETSIATYKGE